MILTRFPSLSASVSLVSSHLDAASASVILTAFATISSYLLLHAGQQQPSSWAAFLGFTHIVNTPNGERFPDDCGMTKSHSESPPVASFCLMNGNLPCSVMMLTPSEHAIMNLAEIVILKLPSANSSSASWRSCMSSIASGDDEPYFTPQMA